MSEAERKLEEKVARAIALAMIDSPYYNRSGHSVESEVERFWLAYINAARAALKTVSDDDGGLLLTAEQFRQLCLHYQEALTQIVIEDDAAVAQDIACKALTSSPHRKVNG